MNENETNKCTHPEVYTQEQSTSWEAKGTQVQMGHQDLLVYFKAQKGNLATSAFMRASLSQETTPMSSSRIGPASDPQAAGSAEFPVPPSIPAAS